MLNIFTMSNPYFQFKQFTIYQDRCAMKVGTDGVLLGAWVSICDARRILDMGTGTGLIALMMAQRTASEDSANAWANDSGLSRDANSRKVTPIQIDAVEIDEASYKQACENVERSPWTDQIHLFYHQSMQKYSEVCQQRYDLIVSNPPYFANAYESSQPLRSRARHSDLLQPAELFSAAAHLLHGDSKLALIYPHEQM